MLWPILLTKCHWVDQIKEHGIGGVCVTNGCTMAQAVSRRPPTAEARVRSWFSQCGICGGQSGTGTGFSPEYFGFSLSVSFHRAPLLGKMKKN
jgi:hypothetical protein